MIEDWQQHIWILRAILGRVRKFQGIRAIVIDLPGDAVFLAHPAHCGDASVKTAKKSHAYDVILTSSYPFKARIAEIPFSAYRSFNF